MTNAKLPPAWELALLSLREAHAQIPAHVSVHEVPAPKEIAPFAAAISGETELSVGWYCSLTPRNSPVGAASFGWLPWWHPKPS